MKLAQFKPVQYVDTYSDLPVEWLQGQLESSQKRYDIQRSAVDKQADLLKNIKYGELGKDVYGKMKSDYEQVFKQMSDDLALSGDVSSISRQFSDSVRSMALDERFRELDKEYNAYEAYQKNMANPEYAGAVNLLPYATEAGLQIGEDLPLSQALQYYQVTKPQNSFEDIEKSFQQFKPSTVDGKTWTMKDPLTNNIITGTEGYLKGLFKGRLKETLNSYYNTWNVSGKSQHHKQKILQAEGLNPITDMGIFNTPKGKELYDKHAEFLMGYAYEEKVPGDGNQSGGSGKISTPNNKDGKEEKFTPISKSTYGRTNNGFAINPDGSISREKLNSRQAYEMHEANLENLINQKTLEIDKLPKNSPERLQLEKQVKNYNAMLDVSISDREKIEGKLFGKELDPAKIAKAQETAGQALVNAIAIADKKFEFSPWMSVMAPIGQIISNSWKTIAEIPEGIIQAIASGNSDFLGMPISSDKENIEMYLKEFDKEWKKQLAGTPEGELYYNYQKYLANQSTGKSYLVNDTKGKASIDNLVQSLFNKDASSELKNVLNNANLNQGELDAIIPEKDGKRDYSALTYEILLDEEDGPVLVIHGKDEDGKTKGVEVPMSSFGNTGEFFGSMISDEEKVYIEKFTQATNSLRQNNGQIGSFPVNSFTGPKDVTFAKTKIGNGQYGYVVFESSDGTKDKLYGSLDDLIYNEILPYSMEDMVIKGLYAEMNAALKSKNFSEASVKLAAINKMIAESTKTTSGGKQDPQTNSKGPLGLGK
jgi:hypothetical protein